MISITSSTSIIGIRLISGSSRSGPAEVHGRTSAAVAGPLRRGGSPAVPSSITKPSTVARKWRQKIMLGIAMTRPETGVVERDRNAVARFAAGLEPPGAWEPKISIMPDHGAEQPHQRADRGDGAERSGSVPRSWATAAGLPRWTLQVARAGLRTLRRTGDSTGRGLSSSATRVIISGEGPRLPEFATTFRAGLGRDFAAPQGDEPLDDQRHRNDGCKQQRPDGPAA